MTQEEKDLLLKDLCARLPYGVIVEYGCKHEDKDLGERKGKLTGRMLDSYFQSIQIGMSEVYSLKPYLRPMESMTDEECNEYQELYDYEERSYNQGCEFYDEWKVEINDEERLFKITDWLNAHHFDYRGLIEKGLALPATEEMYKTK